MITNKITIHRKTKFGGYTITDYETGGSIIQRHCNDFNQVVHQLESLFEDSFEEEDIKTTVTHIQWKP